MRRTIASFIFIFFSWIKLISQIETTEWDHEATKYNKIIIPSSFKNEDAIIVDDLIEFDLNNSLFKTIKRTVLLKVQTENGIKQFNSASLPQSFDIAGNKELWQQGRLAKVKIPFIRSFNIKYFIARIIKPNGKTINLKIIDTYSKTRRISTTGEYYDDDIITFAFENLEINDLLEYSYMADFKPSYGNDMIYFSSSIPKLNVNYTFKYLTYTKFKNSKYVFMENIPDSCISFEHQDKNDELSYVTERVKMNNIQKVNYFIHSMPVKQLPYAYINVNYITRLFDRRRYSLACAPDLNWRDLNLDTDDDITWYTKVPIDIRKFLSHMPDFKDDPNNIGFIKALNDTLISYKYLSANYLFYNDPRLYSLYSTDHLLKRRLSEINLFKLYREILNEKKIFYYIMDVEDKRFGEHDPFIWRKVYENITLAIPLKNSFNFFIPRFNGLNYYINELPFYYEDAVAALFPVNYQKLEGDTIGNRLKFTKTFSSNWNNNIRIENSLIKVKTDSAKCLLDIQESLSGQFSTLLRHLYLNESIDSTVNPIYFKKCIDKPYVKYQKYVLKTKAEEYPFPCEFMCSTSIPLKELKRIDLHNWFSFPFNKDMVTEKPNHDFYFDFEFSDIYNFTFEFDHPVTIENAGELQKSIQNDYFELSSSLEKQNDSYLLKIIARVKKRLLPKEDAVKLIEFINMLDEINGIKLSFGKLGNK